MNDNEQRYTRYAICREMLETPKVIRSMPVDRIKQFNRPSERAFLTGEGSSRIFPAKRLRDTALTRGYPGVIFTESASDAARYDLSGMSVYVASNSGKTAECVRLIRSLRSAGAGDHIVGIAGDSDTPVAAESDEAYVLTCGPEEAVAATKSVMEQALFYDILYRLRDGRELPDLEALAAAVRSALWAEVPAALTEAVAAAPVVYFAGRNNGVAEELTLKANEIVRARSDFLPGTYAVHGIEEVMDPGDVVIWIDPPAEYEEKFRTVLEEGVGLRVFAVASRDTSFPTVRVPDPPEPELAGYLQLAAGWNLLVEAGVSLGLDMDKPERARKVGNEFTGE